MHNWPVLLSRRPQPVLSPNMHTLTLIGITKSEFPIGQHSTTVRKVDVTFNELRQQRQVYDTYKLYCGLWFAMSLSGEIDRGQRKLSS